MTDYTSSNMPTAIIHAGTQIQFPEWAETIPSSEEVSGLHKVAFADPDNRLLPTHTKSATLYSCIDFKSNPHNYSDETKERLDKSAKFHNITDTVAAYDAVFSDMDKSASTGDQEFGLCVSGNAGDVRMFPLSGPDAVVSSAEDLAGMMYNDRIPAAWSYSAAVNLVKSASKYDILDKLPNSVSTLGDIRHMDKCASLEYIKHMLPHSSEPYETVIQDLHDNNMDTTSAILAIEELNLDNREKRASMHPVNILTQGVSEYDLNKASTSNVVVRDIVIPLEDVQTVGRALPDVMRKLAYSMDANLLDKVASLNMTTSTAQDMTLALDGDAELSNAFLQVMVKLDES